jgi:hypothetical protein
MATKGRHRPRRPRPTKWWAFETLLWWKRERPLGRLVTKQLTVTSEVQGKDDTTS